MAKLISRITNKLPTAAELGMEPNYSAVFVNNPGITQSFVSAEVPLILNNLNLSASYSNFPWEIWDATTSRIKPSKVRENYNLRYLFNCDSLVPSVVTFKLFIPETNQIIYEKVTPLLKLTGGLVIEEISFYTGTNFVTYGALASISATEVLTSIYNPSFYFTTKN